jgi:hypothetical protein
MQARTTVVARMIGGKITTLGRSLSALFIIGAPRLVDHVSKMAGEYRVSEEQLIEKGKPN